MARTAHKFALVLLASVLIASLAVPSVSLAAIPGSYYSVAVWPDVPGSFASPGDVAVNSAGEVYVADTSNCRIKRMSSAGAVLSVWGSRGTGTGQFSDPQGVTVLPSGRVVVSDTGNNRLQLFEADGTYVATWGSPGSGTLQFSAPSGLGVDTSGNVYVADSGNGRIQKISSAGAYVASIGTYGPGNGQLDNPRDVAVDAAGAIYVADTNNRRIEKFTAAGAYTTFWGPVEVSGTTYSRYSQPSGVSVDASGFLFVVDPGGTRVTPSDPSSAIYYVERCSNTGAINAQWGTTGTTSGKFVTPRGVAARPGGGAYVADSGNNRVQVLSNTGTVLAIWTGRGSATGVLDTPQGVTLDGSGNAYVADTLNNRVQVFDSAGVFVRAFGSAGTGDGQFNAPTDLVIAPSGNLLVVDKGNNRVQILTTTGTFVSKFGTSGTGNGQFSSPQGIGVDTAGNIYVADTNNARMQRFTSAGVYVDSITSSVSAPLSAPVDVALDSSSNIYLLDQTRAQLHVYTSARAYVRTIGSSGSTDGQFFQPTGVAVGGSSVYVTDSGNYRVQRLTTSGTFETKFGTQGGGTGELAWPARSAIDSVGRVLVVERDNHRLQLFSYDGTAPTTSYSGFSSGTTYSEPVTLTLSASDAGSGVSATYYSVNGVQHTYLAPVSIASEGLNTIRYWSVDRAGNTEGLKTAYVTIDRTPPSGTMVLAGGEAYVGTTTVVATASFSDAVDMRYNANGSWPTEFEAYAASKTLTLSGEGPHTVYAEFRDFVGNVASLQDAITVDLTPPASSAEVSPPDWTNTPAIVTLAAADSASGVASIKYRVGESGTFQTYVDPIVVADEGVTTVYFYAIDRVGNVEGVDSTQVRIDVTPPTGTLVLAGGEPVIGDSAITLASDVPDAVSMRVDASHGFGDWVDYAASASTFAPHEGSIPVQVEYRDRAGNILALGGSVDVDLAPPTTQALGIPLGEASAPVTVTLEATDTVSGVATSYYQLGSGPVETYTEPFVVSAEGTTTVTFWSQDRVGHTEEPQTVDVRIDTTAPIGTFVLDGGAPWALSETVSADVSFTDAIDMRFDTGAGYGSWLTYADSTPLTLSGEGLHRVEAGFRDDVGNIRILQDEIFVDLAAPHTEATLESTDWSPEPVTVTLAAEDSGSGVASVHYRIGSVESTYTEPFEVATEGETTVEFWAVDQAGRVEDAHTVTVRVDTIAPSGTMWLAAGSAYAITKTVALDSVVSGAAEMQIDSGFGYGEWVPYAPHTTVSWRLDGVHTVNVRYRDLAGNMFTLTDSVIQDTIAPTMTDVRLSVDSWRLRWRPTGTVRATWSANDAGPVTGYSYVIDTVAGTVPDRVADTTATSLRTTVPVHGTYFFHIRARDAAGNWGPVRTVRFVVSSRRSYGRVFP